MKKPLQPNKDAEEFVRKLHGKEKRPKKPGYLDYSEKKESIRYDPIGRGVNLNYKSNEYDKEQLRENLIRLEEKFRNGQIGEADYRRTKAKYQSMLYEYEHSKVEANSFKQGNDNYCSTFSAFGFFMGGWIGYLFRPSTNILGFQQLSIQHILDFITNYQKCSPWLDDSLHTDYIYRQCQEWYFYKNPIATSMAYASIEYIITGAILGIVVGWVVGKLIKK
jgi:hypothetical protein